MPTPDEITAALRDLTKKRLLVGVPMDRNPRQGEAIGNASLAYIHNFGSPGRNIPQREFMGPGIAAAQPQINTYLREAALAALNGDTAGIDAGLAKAGTAAVRSIQATIQAGIPPPLEPATVRRRRIRTPGSTYRRQAVTAADTTPLIDTGSMLRSITYVIREE